MRARRSLAAAGLAGALWAMAAHASPSPVAVAPGAAPGRGVVDTRCPTFHWTAVEGATAYEIVVLEVDQATAERLDLAAGGDAGSQPRASMRTTLPAAATGWTPSLEQCLGEGLDYAWMVRARHARRWGAWSEPGIFHVQASDDEERLRRLVREMLDESLDESRDALAASPVAASTAAVRAPVLVDMGLSSRDRPNLESGTQRTEQAIAAVPNAGIRAESTNAVDNSAAVLGVSTAATGFVHGVKGTSQTTGGPAVYGHSTALTAPGLLAAGVRGDAAAVGGLGVYGFSYATTGSGAGVRGDSASSTGYGGIFLNGAGGDLIGGHDGVVLRFRVTSAGNVFADGSYNCGGAIGDAAGTLDETEISPCLVDDSPADFAEMLPASGTGLEAGDVLVLTPEGELAASDRPFQSSVIGVYSTRPSYLGNSRFAGRDDFAPVALVGVVPVKVTTQNGPIRAGDLLVSSSVRGHAMRSGKGAPQGTVIGKALGMLDEGAGVVQMVAMLQ